MRKEHLVIEMATRILERKYENGKFFTDNEANAFVKELMSLDISYDNRLQLEIYYQILKNYRLDFDIVDKDSLMVDIFKIREQFYLDIIHFQEFNRILANAMRDNGDTTLFLRFNSDAIGDVMFASIAIGDKPANTIDKRLSDKLLEVQKNAFWDRVDFYNQTNNINAIERMRDSKDYLFAVLKRQPNFIALFNEILKRNNLEIIPSIDKN